MESLRERLSEQIVHDVLTGRPAPDDAGLTALRLGVRVYLGFVDAAIAAWLDLPDGDRAPATRRPSPTWPSGRSPGC